VTTFLTAYLFAPLTAWLEDDNSRLVCANISLYTSVSVVAILVFMFVKTVLSLADVIIGFAVSFFKTLSVQGQFVPQHCSKDVFPYVGWKVFCCIIGSIFFWLTFFVDNATIAFGAIPFVSVISVVVINFGQGWLGFFDIFCGLFSVFQCDEAETSRRERNDVLIRGFQ
jgi:hypothetical protein